VSDRMIATTTQRGIKSSGMFWRPGLSEKRRTLGMLQLAAQSRRVSEAALITCGLIVTRFTLTVAIGQEPL
jgi:hypothetical protein